MSATQLDSVIRELKSTPKVSSLGLEFSSSERRPGTELLGESYILNFLNKNSRSLQIIYYPPSDGRDFFLLNIKNTETNGTFNLTDWLKQNGKHDAVATLDSINNINAFDKKVKHLADFLNSLLKDDDLNGIMRGDHWQEVYFDWAGMK